MRLTTRQRELIFERIRHHLGADVQSWLFGSRMDDDARGGDVDLYVEAPPHPLMAEVRCKRELQDLLDLPVDLIVRPIGDNSPIASIAKNEGLPL